ncbi:MAG: hypothetical protein ACEPOW_13830 [Bacteroidales bacterium]
MSNLNYAFLLNLELYNAVIVFSLGGTKESIIEYVKGNTTEGSGIPEMLEREMEDLSKTRFHGVMERYEEQEMFLVWMKSFDPMSPDDWAATAHEIFHLTMHLMDSREAKFDLDNHEPYAYLNGYLHQIVNEAVNSALKQEKDGKKEN